MEEPRRPCEGNEGITCSDPEKCRSCGWNPEVAKARIDKFNKTIKEETK